MRASEVKMDGYPYPTSAAATASMKGNRRTDTRPEVALRAALHVRGLRFRKNHPAHVDGGRATRIDIAFTRVRVAVFLDGCFWHGCPIHGNVPSANPHYWPEKLRRNRERDRIVTESLERDGWMVIRLWEHVPLAEAATAVEWAVRLRSQRLSHALRVTPS